MRATLTIMVTVGVLLASILSFSAGVRYCEARAGQSTSPKAGARQQVTPVRQHPELPWSWVQNKREVTWIESWDLIGADTRVYATVWRGEHDVAWGVYHNGALYGNYTS